MENILVTGGSGLVGRHLRKYLPDAVYLSSKDFDLRSEEEVRRLFTSKWNRVIHLAARVAGILDNRSRPAEFLEDNLLINTVVLKYARESGVRRFTAILSTCIYPDVANNYPMTEEMIHDGPPQATNFGYAISKRTLAAHIDACNTQYGTSYNYLIPCNLYGEFDKIDKNKSHFVTALLVKILEAERNVSGKINLLGTGKPLRQFMHAEDLAKVIAQCVKRDATQSFNVAVSENLSIREIAEIALKATGNEGISIDFDSTGPDGQFRKDVSNAKMLEIFPGFEFTGLAEGLARVYSYYKSNY
jgi:GDP-L-fucose synthase